MPPLEYKSSEYISPTDKYKISFQPAVHIVTPDEYAALQARWESKDWYHAHGWDPVSTARASSVNASLYGIDSLTYQPNYIKNKGNMDTFAWLMLPDSPARLNKKGEIFLPTVDIFQNIEVENNTSASAALRAIEQKTLNQTDYDELIYEVEGTTALAAGFLSFLKLSWDMMRSSRANTVDAVSDRGFSRRDFLKFAGIVGTASILPSLYQNMTISNATHAVDEQTKEKWLNYSTFLRNWDFYYSEILYGRTAAMIQRTKEAMHYLDMDPKKPGVVLNGERHASNVTAFLENEDYRLKAMDTGFKNMTQFSIEIANTYGLDAKRVKQALFDHYTPVQIYKISDPSQAPSYPARAAVGESIELLDEFISPSTQQIAEKYLG